MLVGDRTDDRFRILRYQRFYTEDFTYVSVEHYLKCGFRCIYCITDSQGKTRPTIADPAEFKLAFAHDLAHFNTDNFMFCVSGATDPYNDIEEENGFTRHVVDELTAHNRRFSITTKGPLVVRDIDLFLRLPHERYKVLVTISASTTELARRMEPFAPPPEDRIAAVHQLQAAGVHTFVGVYPWIPEVTDTDRLLSLLPKGVTVCFQPLELGHNFDETLDNQRSRFSADRGFSKTWTQDEINRAYIHECNTVGRKYWKDFTMEWRHPITRASHSDNGGYLKKMRPGRFDPDQWVAENPVYEAGRG
jgi:DNA repair photolyase